MYIIPKYIWVRMLPSLYCKEGGDAKIINPKLELDGLSGHMMLNVAPRHTIEVAL